MKLFSDGIEFGSCEGGKMEEVLALMEGKAVVKLGEKLLSRFKHLDCFHIRFNIRFNTKTSRKLVSCCAKCASCVVACKLRIGNSSDCSGKLATSAVNNSKVQFGKGPNNHLDIVMQTSSHC
jgi:hypothetical protein